MKKLAYLFLAVGVIVLASCETASKKSEGTYNGNAVVNSTSYSGTCTVTANGDDKVNVQITANSVTYNATGVSASLSNDVVTFTYTSATTTSNELTQLSGNLTGNTISLTGTIMFSNPFTIPASFTGAK